MALQVLKHGVDATDAEIIRALTDNARMSMRDLADRVGMSAPSVTERVRRLEEAGIIRGYTLDIDMAALGYPLQAIVRIRPLPGQMHVVERMIEAIPEFIECDKVTGEDCFVARLCLRAIGDLDDILSGILERAMTNSAIIKATAIDRRMPPL